MTLPCSRPPLTNIYLQTRVLPAVPGNCALRKTQPIPPPYINNVAVPGALVVDPLDNSGNPTALTTFFLGGQTQIQAMRRAEPAVVHGEVGVTDGVGAAPGPPQTGQPAAVHPLGAVHTLCGVV